MNAQAAGVPDSVARTISGHRTDSAHRRYLITQEAAQLAALRRMQEADEPPLQSGYWKLYVDHVTQADEGVDLDFLVGRRGAFVPRDNH